MPRVGSISPHTCEALALVNELYFCVQAGLSHVVIEGDACNVIAALNGTEEDLSVDGGIIDEAKFLLSFFQSCSWSSISRASNNAAH